MSLWAEAGQTVKAPFPRMAYRDAMARYGTDKPDLRFGLEIRDVTALIGEGSGDFLRTAKGQGGTVRVIVVPDGARLSRKDFDQLTDEARTMKASGLLWAKQGPEGTSGPGAKALGAEVVASLGLKDGDSVVGCAGSEAVVLPALGRVRLDIVRRLGLKPSVDNAFTWIEQFPMFERDPVTGARAPMHHPFTAPHPEDVDLLESDPDRARSTHYDPVVNGVELGSGSIRIVDPALQSRVFDKLGLTSEQIEHRFGFLLEGLRVGAPPMGGIALGFDRITMLLAGAESLRDVIAFPKTTAAAALFEGAPTTVSQEDLDVLHLRVVQPPQGKAT